MKKILLLIIILSLIFSVNSTVFAEEMTLEDWTESVVRVVAYDKQGNWLWYGTGFAVGEGEAVEYFVTNNHVIDGEGQDIDLFVRRSKDHEIKATVVSALPVCDLAIIRTREKLYGYTPFVLCDEEAEVSSHCYALGFPGDSITDDFKDSYAEDITITKGIISKRTQRNGVKVYQTNTDINPGNSGGPLVNEKFEVIGVNTFGKLGTNAAVNGSMYISNVTDVLKSMGIKYRSSTDVEASVEKNTSNENDTQKEQPVASVEASNDNGQSEGLKQEQSVAEEPVVAPQQVQQIVKEEKNDSQLILIIAGIALLVIIIAVVAFLLLKGNSKPKGMIMGANLVMPYEISEVPIVIGRDGSVCNIVDNSQGISRRHCTVSHVNGAFLLVDLSSNGTYLSDGTRLEKSKTYKLNHGDSFYLVDKAHLYQLSDK